jgi:hypothetical protein
MSDDEYNYIIPDVLNNSDGDTRTAGFELEFSGITLADTVDAVCNVLQGNTASQTAAEVELDTAHGSFNIEIDWDFLKRTAADDSLPDEIEPWVEQLSDAAALLVPIEVVCPPIPLDRLDVLDPMVVALRDAGAVGTEESLIAAYGVHINPEIPSLDVDTLDRYLKAYVLLQWWLVDTHDVDPARRISPYIDLYEQPYMKQVLTSSPTDISSLIDDYLEHNPSRNRALDMLPMFAEIDEDRVRHTIDDPKIKLRPTFHYRLPNCRIDDSGWHLSKSWNTWCVVEQLANDAAAISRLADEFIGFERPLMGVDRDLWVGHIDTWRKDHS